MFIFSVIKSLTQEDKKKLTEIYGKLSEIDLELIKLDLESSEKKDVEFIKQVYNSWQEIKRELIPILGKLKSNKDNKMKKNLIVNILDNYPSTIVPINLFSIKKIVQLFQILSNNISCYFAFHYYF